MIDTSVGCYLGVNILDNKLSDFGMLWCICGKLHEGKDLQNSHLCKIFTPVHFCLLANQQYIVKLQIFPSGCRTSVIRETFLPHKFLPYSNLLLLDLHS